MTADPGAAAKLPDEHRRDTWTRAPVAAQLRAVVGGLPPRGRAHLGAGAASRGARDRGAAGREAGRLARAAPLGRTLKQRAADVLGCFDRPNTSNGTTEAINGRLEHLRGSALGFRNLTNEIARRLLEPADPDPDYSANCDQPISALKNARPPGLERAGGSAQRRRIRVAQHRRVPVQRSAPCLGGSLGMSFRPGPVQTGAFPYGIDRYLRTFLIGMDQTVHAR